MIKDQRATAAHFFDAFCEAFHSFVGSVIAQRYHSPFLAVQADGTVETMQSVADTAAYFQKYLDYYRDEGCRTCTYTDLEVSAAGPSCILATVTWKLLDDDDEAVLGWRESYLVAEIDSELLVLSSITHP